ncbi:hypothetical protein FNV43_RR24823 [Rhamnella rubrinervis]|uniref:Uncharacterized protein n=1 Tax=Rhamnella rubrinervis TaxID=2594499 RepID=A0A8K0GTJ5_9ROSA|nr:hypothetical protein FNV43_RR24823 [Rhamnella rubrinervis]
MEVPHGPIGEMGDTESARNMFKKFLFVILCRLRPCSRMLVDGPLWEGKKRLEEARDQEEDYKAKEARDVKPIILADTFLTKTQLISPALVDDLRFTISECEAKEQFEKYRELSPKKFEVEGYLRTPLSKMKLFGTDES